jgi:hypothetical protein
MIPQSVSAAIPMARNRDDSKAESACGETFPPTFKVFRTPHLPHNLRMASLPQGTAYVDITLFPAGKLEIADYLLHKDGTDEKNVCPDYSFLIEHPSGKKIFFDLGLHPVHYSRFN